MTRRNLLSILFVSAVSLVCYLRVEHNPYARYLGYAMRVIDRHALEPAPAQQLFNGAMDGIVDQLDDYSAFISEEDVERFEADLKQEIVGIGVRIGLEGDDKQLTVMTPPEFGSPAQKAGIRAQDKILKIDGVETKDKGLEEIVKLIRGGIGSKVKLTVLHAGEDVPHEFDITRATISVPSVVGDRPLGDGTWDFHLEDRPHIGYIRISSFGEKTIDELRSALEMLREQDVEAIVLDLRSNPGGLLESAYETCDLFLSADKVIVSIRGRGQELQGEYVSTDEGEFTEIPLAVLVNELTASASEIVAACLQDHERAVVVGTRSFGKGTVQHVIRMESNKSILKLTAASYWRPSGKNIHRLQNAKEWGVSPDEGCTVELTEEQTRRMLESRRERDIFREDEKAVTAEKSDDEDQPVEETSPADPQLEKAIERLEEILKRPDRESRAA